MIILLGHINILGHKNIKIIFRSYLGHLGHIFRIKSYIGHARS